MTTFIFLFLGLTNIFMGSLLTIARHRLELIRFSAKPGNKCCHGNLFYVSWAYKSFLGFFTCQTPAQIGADWFFGNTRQQVLPWQHFFLFRGLIFLWVLCISNPFMNRSWLAFQQYLAPSVAVATLFLFLGCGYKKS